MPDGPSSTGGHWSRTRLRAWHRILSAGTSDVARFRGWDRLITWRSHATATDRRCAVAAFLKLPARAAKESYADVREFGREVAAESGVPRSLQLRQLWWLRVRHGIGRTAYLDYQLYRPERWRQAVDYVPVREFFQVGRFIRAQRAASDGRVLFDKRLFDSWCREHDLPTVPTLMEFENGHAVDAAVADGSLPAVDLFSKPSDSTGGHGAARWMYDGDGGYVGGGGRVWQPADLLEELARMSRTLPARYGMQSSRILLQQCLRNHRALLPLTPGGLCTVRLQTYRWPGGEPELLFAAYKMPVGDAPADNFHFGGIVAPVDVTTGRLGPAIHRRGKLIVGIERHTDTGTRIEGHQIPLWEDTKQLVLRAHAAVPRIAAVGWDVAVLDDGPVLVEGNSLPNPDIAQAPSGVPLGATLFVRCLNAHLRECFDV
jgi:hypothetical protein